MNTLKTEHTEDSQRVATFSGEGAYHGASQGREKAIPDFEEDESKPLTLINKEPIDQIFHPVFWDRISVVKQLSVPSQEEIKNDGVTFMWAPFEQAKAEAGPVTRDVLLEMEPFLERKKRFIYIDSKIQYFEAGDVPVDSKLWHIDGIVSIRDKRATDLGYPLLHDLKARMTGGAAPPKYLAYQSSTHCATQFVKGVMVPSAPVCIPSFDILDKAVAALDPPHFAQPAGSIVSFDGFSLHRAVPATAAGWRLWIRCTETDKEIKLSSTAIACYGSVYRTHDQSNQSTI